MVFYEGIGVEFEKQQKRNNIGFPTFKLPMSTKNLFLGDFGI